MIETRNQQHFDFEIQPMKVQHLDKVARLAKICHLGIQNKPDGERELLDKDNLKLVATDSENLLGFMSSRLIMSVVEVLEIGVLPEQRRFGVGRALLKETLEFARKNNFTESWLEVRESNLSAQQFYLAHNFKIVGRRKNYYSDPVEDAILMTLIFSDSNPKN